MTFREAVEKIDEYFTSERGTRNERLQARRGQAEHTCTAEKRSGGTGSMGKHAFLSPSASERWLNCTLAAHANYRESAAISTTSVNFSEIHVK